MTFWRFLQLNYSELLMLIWQHIVLVFVAITIAVVIGVPVGILLTRYRRASSPVLGVANIMQTIPSLALFGFLIPLPFIGGIGARTALVALVLYSLLPIIRNTVTGVLGVDPNVREAAVAAAKVAAIRGGFRYTIATEGLQPATGLDGIEENGQPLVGRKADDGVDPLEIGFVRCRQVPRCLKRVDAVVGAPVVSTASVLVTEEVHPHGVEPRPSPVCEDGACRVIARFR